MKNVENLQKPINHSISVKSSFEQKILKLQSSVDELKQEITLRESFCKYYDNALRTLKNEIVKKQDTLEQLKRLCREIYDMKA